ncbi:unnamed protein product [Didymodactylos carnosus]|uniref:E3 ubiquitin-protein ligase n=1 Tax=Didymodactylos carnosus TaxID=1234261 RepID=A0A814HIL5_9BILA|nr:unnamed protein product [Didymodactylos carnosus]CAF3782857.1 unnamed protein product [Didymodactylos carnosus]
MSIAEKPFPRQYFDRPDVIESSTPTTTTTALTIADNSNVDTTTPRHVWYYEGRGGWWQYDQRTNTDLDAAFMNGQRNIDLLIAGFVYVIDFENMLQYRQNETQRRRRIKYDLVTAPKKGVAGLKLNDRQRRDDPENQSQVLSSSTTVTTAPQSSHAIRITSDANIVPSLRPMVSSVTGTSPPQAEILVPLATASSNNDENNISRSDADGGEEIEVSQLPLSNRSIIDDSVPVRRPVLGASNYQTWRSNNESNSGVTVRGYVGNFDSDSSVDTEDDDSEEETNSIRPTLIGEASDNISRRADFLLGSSGYTPTSNRSTNNNSSTLLSDSIMELHVTPRTH